MSEMITVDLTLNEPIYDETIPAGEPWYHVVKAGEVLRIVDLEGCQAVDTLFYNANDVTERYSAPQTIVRQKNIFVETGTELVSNLGNTMMKVISDTCGRHDTLGGACSAESNTVRYALDKLDMHSCRDNYLLALGQMGMDKRDLVSNINFFMNVPVEADGTLAIIDGISTPGSTIELIALMDTLVLISNCPQLNNPCNAFNPTPVRLSIYKPF
ncbi:urea carboxylase-associated protein 1 [Sulfuricurvum kujiense DSM 16994]|uniref:Urea carboxylase-associated protein 1 n=1 Tax=Sulfuricurvum kujiense (strain ATCC BAA-921 / DSM 16994 / JCM 11577 / YK-1) TaxID=709032 RepID=E4TWW4_SULKY|nr:urea amidolyase associated protein UAAP2 [Sulfuricurvum kujiense]ADR32795.1 urea carboxylase-associated protein 1 [Sulfuricurvum kujiense DSM 16994]